jgi:hypothetical protein
VQMKIALDGHQEMHLEFYHLTTSAAGMFRAHLAPRFGNKNARFRVKTQKAICLALRFLKRNILKTLNLSVFGTEVMGDFFKTAVF